MNVTVMTMVVIMTLILISGIAFFLSPKRVLQAAGAGTLAGGVGGLISWGVCLLLDPPSAPYCAIAGGAASAVTSEITFSLTTSSGPGGLVISWGG
ncbi:hypothetical protein [Ignicoccus hospitalis]|uniref:hypothetical protein n=1 Tax=Ignicoccus hospitalis TaxID=160233 RepID=UPI00032307C8|nr:hypothetical protein [Ignicoccus hospitalis]HIH90190.1 hypothetical protein [Desulfurococcaceae archaeon]